RHHRHAVAKQRDRRLRGLRHQRQQHHPRRLPQQRRARLAGHGFRQLQQHARRNRHAPAQRQYRRVGGLRHRQQPDHQRRLHRRRRPGVAVLGRGHFSGVPGETDLLLRNVNTGGLEVYDINNNQLTGAAFLGPIGLEWQFAGVAPVSGAGRSDLVLRNVNTGAFEVYDIANNMITSAPGLGAVGLDWQLGGFAIDPPTASMGDSNQVAQLVQAMAGFGGASGAADDLDIAVLAADTSQPFLTTPQPA